MTRTAERDDVPAYPAALREGRRRTAEGLKPRPVQRMLDRAFRAIEGGRS